jgi:hypothetical protein
MYRYSEEALWRFLAICDQKAVVGGACRAHDVTLLDADDRRIIKALKSMGTCRIQLAGFVKDGNWTLEPRFYVGKHGQFVVSEDLDTSVEQVDILPDIKSLFQRAAWA